MHPLLFIPMIIGGIIGSMLTGYIEDLVITPIQDIPNQSVDCNQYDHPEWRKTCENLKSNSNKGITLINVVGFIAGFGTVGAIIVRLQN